MYFDFKSCGLVEVVIIISKGSSQNYCTQTGPATSQKEWRCLFLLPILATILLLYPLLFITSAKVQGFCFFENDSFMQTKKLKSNLKF